MIAGDRAGKGLFSRIFASVMASIALGLLAFGVLAAASVREYFFQLSYVELAEVAGVAARAVSPLAARGAPAEEIDALIDSLAAGGRRRLTYMDPSGNVLADSEGTPGVMQNHADRPEVKEALRSGSGFARRRSASVAVDLAYAAVALRGPGGDVIGVARASLPVTIVTSQAGSLARRLALIGAFIALAGAAASLLLARSIASPLARVRDGAAAFALGRLDEPPLPVTGPREIAELSSSLNRMAAELDGRMALIRGQKREAEAILSGMSEGVIVAGKDFSVKASNPAARRLFGASGSEPSLIEFCRNTEILDFARAAFAARDGMETTIAVYASAAEDAPRPGSGEGSRTLRIASSPLEGGQAVLVFNDLTRMHRLETVRKDFTANVSHELKTPLTVVRSALETLEGMDLGPGGGTGEADTARRFIASASRQAERLSAIIEDILALARIEEEEGRGIELEPALLRPVMEAAVEAIRPLADAKSIRLSLACPDELAFPMKASLVRQALVNLIDNAVKYSESGTEVRIEAASGEGFARLSVSDHGKGIPLKDRPRIFERFYRVDPARSRELGGTGLGLSIVKHIAKAHGGSVSVESEEGRGSTFTIELPRSDRPL